MYSVIADTAMCGCNCEYKMRLDHWASQEPTNYTLEELKTILLPVTQKIRKDLLVNTSTLSSTIYKLKCMQDDRPSSQKMGFVGIAVLSIVVSALVIADLTSLSQCVRKT